jgi:peptidyl-prolyl cis-trans isomerase A (cyclophilin A)
VTLGADTNLNPTSSGSYTIFGKVLEGMSTIDKIANVPTTSSSSGENSQPTQAVYIDGVQVQER